MRRLASIVLLSTLAAVSVAEPPPEGARACAQRLGEVLERHDASGLLPLLPEAGTVRLDLSWLGAREGTYSAGQVVAVFATFFEHGEVRSFEIVGPEQPGAGYALIRARATVVDRSGMQSTAELHISVESEAERWVLRKIQESRR